MIIYLQQMLSEGYILLLIYVNHIHLELRNEFGYLYFIYFSNECTFHSNGVEA